MVLITMLLVKGDESSDKADVCAGKGEGDVTFTPQG